MPRSRAFRAWLDEVTDGRSRWADTERGLETRPRSDGIDPSSWQYWAWVALLTLQVAQMVVITRLIS